MRTETGSVADLVRLNDALRAELEGEQASRARMEESVAQLATLCAAASCLSDGIQRKHVPEAISEILTNLVGCEGLATFEITPGASALTMLDSFGIDPAPYRSVPLGAGRIGEAALSGDMYLADAGRNGESDLIACVPLKLDGTVVGLIAVFRLLPQKAALEPVDRELFALLTTLAAAALRCSAPAPLAR